MLGGRPNAERNNLSGEDRNPDDAVPSAPSPPESATIPGGGRRSRILSGLHIGYFLLASFNILTVSGSVALNHRLMALYEHSTEDQRFWAERQQNFTALEFRVAAANAPGNDVFESGEIAREAAAHEKAMREFRAQMARVRENVGDEQVEGDVAILQRYLDDVERLVIEMSRETTALLTRFEEGKIQQAGEHMARMDRIYAEIDFTLALLDSESQKQQLDSLRKRLSLAEVMRRIEFGLAALIVLLVVVLAIYGFRLSRLLRRNEDERSRQMLALEASEHRFRELAEGSIQGIVVHSDGRPLFANDAWATIHGFANTAAARKVEDIGQFVAPEDMGAVKEIHSTLLIGEAPSRQYEYRAIRKDGQRVWLECLERAVFWQGRPALQSTVIDITERKRVEEDLRDAIMQAKQATSARTRFFAASSHDLRQPLHAISLYLPLLLKRVKGDENLQMLTAIQNSASAMRSLLDSLLDISRLDAGVIEPEAGPVSLLELFDQLAMEFAPQAAAKGLELRMVPADYWVSSDSALLQRILRNLLTNAIRYTHRGRVLLGARLRGERISVEVWDTGIGIAPEKMAHIFEEFYQADNPERDRNRGLGLGLAIIDRLARLLGHPLDARSIPGKGSVFRIELPRTAESLAPARQTREISDPGDTFRGKLVVLVDDDPIVLESTGVILADWGCEVLVGDTVAAAQEQVAKSGRTPDIILADLRLKGEETGLEAVERIRELTGQRVPAIIVTGDTAPERIRTVARSDSDILHKPIDPGELCAAMLKATGLDLRRAI